MKWARALNYGKEVAVNDAIMDTATYIYNVYGILTVFAVYMYLCVYDGVKKNLFKISVINIF